MSSVIDFEIPGYDIIEPIGRGGMASVYRARQHTFDRNVAVKILKPDLSEDDAFCQRFVMESLIVAKLNHSNIVQVYDVGEIKNHYYIAMEFLSGGDLHRKLKEGLPVTEAVSIIKQMASALDFAHRKHIIHRDLKPDNVMFREDEAAVLTDFGIAKETNADINLTQTGLIVGTPKYMSPEQIRGSDPSPQGDIYSLGIMFYQLLCNRVPFAGADLVATAYQHFNEPVPQLPPHLSQYQSLIEHMLAKTVEDRIPRGKDVVRELERIEREHPLSNEANETIVFQTTQEGIQDDETLVKPSLESADADTTVAPAPQAPSSDPTFVKSSSSDQTVAMAATPAPSPQPQPAEETLAPPQAAPSPTPTAPQTSEKKPPVALISGAAAAVVIVLGLVFVLSQPAKEKTTPAPVVNNAQPVENTDQITQLLLGALEDVSNNRLRNGTSNALSKYEQILILSPGHPQALAGKQNIAKKYLSLAKTAISQKKFSQAQSHIDNARDIDPELDVSKMQNALSAGRRDHKNPITTLKKVQIAGLLENAKLFEKEGKVSSPPGENAIENYKKILNIDPYHTEAKARLNALQTQP